MASRRILLLALLPLLLLLALRRTSSAPTPTTTFPGDVAALAALKSAVSSIPPYSCLAAWDFKRDPCAAFPCGLRCHAPPNSSHLRVAGVALDPAGYSGAFPATFLASLPYLATLSLAGNRFHGALPAGVPLPASLRILDLSGNAFTGPIPGSLFTTHASALQELYLARNAFSGSVPPEIASLASLTRLELQHNGLTGSLPPGMRTMRALVHLDLTGNALSGPPPLDALPPSVVSFVARNNSFSGALRAAVLTALPAIRVLDLTGNALTGTVPGAALAHPALQQLRLGSNQLDALEEPAPVSSSGLVELDLSNNRLAGRLPACLGSMPRLAAVALDRNRFTGPIPDPYAARVAAEEATDEWVPFARLMLQGNFLCGALPSQWRQLKEEDGATVSLADNCLPRCPHMFFFCQGPPQKNQSACPKSCDAAINHVHGHKDFLLEMP